MNTPPSPTRPRAASKRLRQTILLAITALLIMGSVLSTTALAMGPHQPRIPPIDGIGKLPIDLPPVDLDGEPPLKLPVPDVPITHDPLCPNATPVVSTPAELTQAVRCYNAQVPAGSHDITLNADIWYAPSAWEGDDFVVAAGSALEVIRQPNPAYRLTIDGHGHTLGTEYLGKFATLVQHIGGAMLTLHDLTMVSPGASTVLYVSPGSSATVSNSVIANSESAIQGRNAHIRVIESDIVGNQAALDLHGGTALFSGVTAVDNSRSIGIADSATFKLIGSTVTGSVDHVGVAIYDSQAEIIDSTIADNFKGLSVQGESRVLLSQSTVAHNRRGADVWQRSVELHVHNSTVAHNTYSGLRVRGPERPDGRAGKVFVESSLLADACVIESGWTLVGSQNFSSAESGCGFTALNSPVGSLAAHGGGTHTVELLPGSNAIDAADCSHMAIELGAAGSVEYGTRETDQRGPGFPRTVGKYCDAGAFEAR